MIVDARFEVLQISLSAIPTSHGATCRRVGRLIIVAGPRLSAQAELDIVMLLFRSHKKVISEQTPGLAGVGRIASDLFHAADLVNDLDLSESQHLSLYVSGRKVKAWWAAHWNRNRHGVSP